MAYTPLSSNTLKVGDALKKETFDLIKSNFDDHEDRLTDAENANAKIIVFDLTVTNATSAGSLTGLTYSEAFFDFNLTACEIRIFEKGGLTGAFEIDVKRSTGGLDDASFSSVFTTRPRIEMATATNYQRSTNQVLNIANSALNTGNTLRLDVTSLPENGVLGKFRVTLYGEV